MNEHQEGQDNTQEHEDQAEAEKEPRGVHHFVYASPLTFGAPLNAGDS